MPNKEPYPKPRPAKRRNPRAVVPKPAKKPKIDRDLREKREMPKREMPKRNPRAVAPKPAKGPKKDRDLREKPKRIPKVKKGTKGSFDDAVRTQNNLRQMLGSTKAQRAASALEMMNDMRSRNILRSRNVSSKPKKRGM